MDRGGKPEVRVNLYLLFVANLADYGEALKAVGHIISFFQHRKSIDYSSVPGLVNQEGRLAFELHSMTFEQQNHLWGALGDTCPLSCTDSRLWLSETSRSRPKCCPRRF